MASGHDSAADSSADVAQPSGDERPREGPLAGAFRRIVESLPDDWTDLELDLRIADESRYVEAAVFMVTCNAQPYSHHDWHFRLLVDPNDFLVPQVFTPGDQRWSKSHEAERRVASQCH